MTKHLQQDVNPHASSEYPDSEKFNRFEKRHSELADSLKIVFIGNSITIHGPAPFIGWENYNGMAASSEHNDYCHILLRYLNINIENAYIGNFAELERMDISGTEIEEQLNVLLVIKKPEIVVIQLGDNVSNNEQLELFLKNLQLVASTAKSNCQTVVLLSTWLESQTKDLAIRRISDLYELTFVYIGDLFNSDANIDRKTQKFAHTGVDNHPRDWGMVQIADKIYSAIKLLSNSLDSELKPG